jgi:1,4-dihydroxy-2-naphthoyl-CoA hydrolase
MAYQAVGLDINANHLRSVPEGGRVRAKATAVHIGRTTHVWQIELTDEREKLVCTSRLTMMIRKAR